MFPLLGAVIITIIRKNFLGNNKSFGLDEIADEMENIEFKIMDLKDTIIKTILTFTTLVFGFSAGKFGPLIHIGGSLGSKLSYHYNFDEEDIRYFIATGVAASLAGFFSSPLFGLFFIVEILLKYRINYRIIYPVIGVISTVVVSELIIIDNFFEIAHNQIILPTKSLFVSLLIVGIVTGIIASI